MAGHSVKLISFIRKYYHAIGIHSPRSNQNRSSLNWKNVTLIICFVQGIISKTAFLVFAANSVSDLGMAVFYWSAMFLGIGLYLGSIWEMGNLSQFVENSEAFIEKSMYSSSPKYIFIKRLFHTVSTKEASVITQP